MDKISLLNEQSLREIRKAIAVYTGVDADDFNRLGGNGKLLRRAEWTLSRQLYAVLLLLNTKSSLSSVGEIVGVDHATILHSKKVISNYIDTNQAPINSRKPFKEVFESLNDHVQEIILLHSAKNVRTSYAGFLKEKIEIFSKAIRECEKELQRVENFNT